MIGIVAIACVGVPASAADTPLLPAETFFRHPAVLDVKLSPSGRYVGITSVQENRRVGRIEHGDPARACWA